MRYELFLTRLPKLEPKDIKAQLGDLPASGLSTGILKKALEEKKLPKVAVGWSDDLKAVEKIRQRIAKLEGAVRVEDHASAVQKIWGEIETAFNTMFSAVGSKVDEQNARRAKVKKAAAAKPKTGKPALAQGTGWVAAILLFFLKTGFGLALYTAHVMSDAPPGAVISEWLWPRLVAATVGIASMHAVTASVSAVLVQRITMWVAAPAVLVPVTVLAFSVVTINAVPEQPVAKQAEVKKPVDRQQFDEDLPPPPSRPYQGLIEELRIRKLKASERVLEEVEDAPGADELPAGVAMPKPKEAADPKAKPGAAAQQVVAQTSTTTPPAAGPAAAVAGQAGAPAAAALAGAAAPAPATEPAPAAQAEPKPEAQPVAAGTAAPKPVAKQPAKQAPPAKLEVPQPELDLDLLVGGAVTFWLVTLVILLWLRNRERAKFQQQAAQIVITYDAKLAGAQAELKTELDTTKEALEVQNSMRATLDRALADAAAERKAMERKLAKAQEERETLERELLELRSQKAREDDPTRSAISRVPKREQPERARAAVVREDDKPTRVEPGGDDERAFGYDAADPPPDASDAARKPAAQPRVAERGDNPRSSYVVRDIQEERISVPKRGK
jgi:hypothetical protein